MISRKLQSLRRVHLNEDDSDDWRAKREMELRRLLHQVRCWLRVMFVLANNLYCIPTYLTWMWIIFYPLRLLIPPLYWAIERQLFKLLLLMVSFWSWSAEYYVEEVGEDVSDCFNERSVVLVNHQSTADVPLLMASFQVKKSVTEHLMWIMDRLFKFTNFGAVSYTHGDFFITQGKDVRSNQLQKLRDHIFDVYIRRGLKWIVLFPEGGFLRKRIATSQRYAKANNYPILEHVTLPRTGALKVVLDTLSRENLAKVTKGKEEPLKWIVDVTIGYPDYGKPLDLLIISGGFRKPCTVHMHYRRFPVSDVPFDSQERLTKWLYDRWVEKEELLDELYRTGRFPGRLHTREGTPSYAPLRVQPFRVDFNIAWIVLIHAFFIMSTLFHVALFRWIGSLVLW
ncbi:acyl-CoA:lysophosphatidylglycerol acyltransferase 1-like isoform X2 [Ornithodoros turicata]|uniref:acyl-CoA:lysophosphatidylglycerol acyltransferase 1-like isoform X2 n=1 Tax=Ornithodoros turicata TaxID=34597 RepID=UPI0031396F27